MSRSLSSINQNLLMTRIFLFYLQFLTFFSIMAIDLLAIIVLQLNDFAKKASELKVLKETTYPFPKVTPIFLRIIIQNYRIKNQQLSASF